MAGHGVDVACRSKIAAAPRPNQYHKHADVIEPIAGNYAAFYTTTRNWPVTPDGIEAFIADDLEIDFVWEEGEDPRVEFYARYDPFRRAIIFNSKYEWLRETRPDLYDSFLSHEIGHVVLRHGEAFDLESGSLFDDDVLVHFLNHPTMRPREMDEELLKRALRIAHENPHVAAALRSELAPERYEPQWMYDQAQHFAGGFIAPFQLLRDTVGDGCCLGSWDGVHQLAKQFGCSNSFMEVRLKKLGLIIVEGNRVRPTPRSEMLSIE